MLPNHAPLVVAEQFGTLDTLHPGASTWAWAACARYLRADRARLARRRARA
jgi:alkanesulfonate monooxygenase SsuD/methylene tetrahydromethanopterin reductase-like flavin-dependent oxidoreductase (luciferase family)